MLFILIFFYVKLMLSGFFCSHCLSLRVGWGVKLRTLIFFLVEYGGLER